MRYINYTLYIYSLWALMVLEGTWLLQLRPVARCALRSVSSNPLGDKVQAPGTAVPTHSKRIHNCLNCISGVNALLYALPRVTLSPKGSA